MVEINKEIHKIKLLKDHAYNHYIFSYNDYDILLKWKNNFFIYLKFKNIYLHLKFKNNFL